MMSLVCVLRSICTGGEWVAKKICEKGLVHGRGKPVVSVRMKDGVKEDKHGRRRWDRDG